MCLLFVSVHAIDVVLQVGVRVEGPVTRLADLVLDRREAVDLFRQGVLRHVAPHAGGLRECLSAHIACMRLLPRMRAHVALHATLLHDKPSFLLYRDTSLIRKRLLLGPYSRLMPRALWWS